ncbi:MAG: hypothetical protein AAF363_11040 [Bacteroidota bacterium]
MIQRQLLLRGISKLFLFGRKGNWKIIILCFFGAGTFWFFNSLNKDYTTRINYPIKFIYNQDSTIVIGELPSKIRMEVSSGGWDILRKSIGFDIDPIAIELRNPTEIKYLTNTTLLPIVSEQITELSVNYIAVDTLFFDIQNIRSRLVLLELDTSGLTIAENHDIVSDLVLKPDTIKLYAPESMIDTLDAFAVRYSENDISSDVEVDIMINLPFPRYNIADPEKIKLSFNVRRFVEKSSDIKVDLVDFPESFATDSIEKIIQLKFMIREDSLSKFNDSSFVVRARFENFNFSDSTVIPRVVEMPSFVKELSFENPQLTFK